MYARLSSTFKVRRTGYPSGDTASPVNPSRTATVVNREKLDKVFLVRRMQKGKKNERERKKENKKRIPNKGKGVQRSRPHVTTIDGSGHHCLQAGRYLHVSPPAAIQRTLARHSCLLSLKDSLPHARSRREHRTDAACLESCTQWSHVPTCDISAIPLRL